MSSALSCQAAAAAGGAARRNEPPEAAALSAEARSPESMESISAEALFPAALFPATLFPLPLEPFELLMHWDDRPSHRMAFEIITEFSGPIDREHFQSAVGHMLTRHPLLTARVAPTRGKPHWHAPVGDALPRGADIVVWADAPSSVRDSSLESLARFQALPLGAAAGGLRILATEHASGTNLVWRFHHAACDGIGACDVIGDVLAIYDALSRGEDWRGRVTPLDCQRLTLRGVFGRGAEVGPAPPPREVPAVCDRPSDAPAPSERAAIESASLDSAPASRGGLKALAERGLANIERLRGSLAYSLGEVRDFVGNGPQPLPLGRELAATSELPRGLGPTPVVAHWLSQEQSRLVRAAARSLDVSENDLLLTAAFRALAKLFREQGAAEHALVRITMPTNMRVGGDVRMPAANVLSYAFLDRRLSETRDFAQLAAGLRHASRAIRRYDLSRQFVETLRGLCRWPRFLRWSLAGPRCLSTAVLSNIGDPGRRFSAQLRREHRRVVAGGMKLERFYGAPPVRPKTSLAIGVSNYAGTLAISAAYDPLVLAVADVKRILASIAEECLASNG